MLKKQMGYEEFSITAEAGVIFDPDLDDNLAKPLRELGIEGRGNAFITVTDDDDVPKVDLVLSSTTRFTPIAPEEIVRVQLVPEKLQLPLKPRKEQTDVTVNGNAEPEPALSSSTGVKRKREAEEEIESEKAKKSKPDAGDVVYVVEDDGAILLDD